MQFSCCEQGLPTLCKAWAIPPTSLPPSLVALCLVGAETRVACLDRMPKCPRVPWQIKQELEEIYERGPVEAAMKLANNALELRQSPAAPEPSSALPTASEDRCATFHLDFHLGTQHKKSGCPGTVFDLVEECQDRPTWDAAIICCCDAPIPMDWNRV